MADVSDTAPLKRAPYGLRGWAILLWGGIWTTWGITLSSFSGERSSASLYDVVVRFLPLEAWGWVWVAVGVLGALAGVLRRHSVGFVILMLMPWGWGVGLIGAHFTAQSPSGIPLGLTFLALGTSIAITSGMEDARVLRRKVTT